ncbi:RagB/SusD family nutrient uptake outer membrane protein [Algoriphagus zhangzhouensis]|uniref:SusD family protein n=1 Tax=Algoriphagus zhangzhouensis TaxID=1073327 RepID=A0A1M7ZKG8_9BACT|nr:RagB/SusD family nutrient uptake outer membrane protein [Algoriphagus zhangzhouensis]TDY42854.1 SusD-like starch-binding protein associating with outer membrane [Algoriphagus zhangzhouensis]SHO65367.1 SusD family protein [Algoriphagus zhangzhouensis]
MRNIRYQFNKIYLLCQLGLAMGLGACSDYLDSKPDRNLVIPTTLDDFQGLLDAELYGMNVVPMSGFIASDDPYFGSGLLARLSFNQNAVYFWEKEIYLPDENDVNWSAPYQKVFYANVVLDGLNEFSPQNQVEENRMLELEASARFYRAMGHFEVLMLFAESFDPSREDQLGVPIRLTSDINQKVGRATMKESFAQILLDLEEGLEFLPVQADIPSRPSQWAAQAMLGRVYLMMHSFEESYQASSRALAIDNTLMNYRELDSTLTYSFERMHPETVFYGRVMNSRFTTNGENYVNPELVALYDSLDMRPFFFFRETGDSALYNFRGNYTGDFYQFGGIATDEVLLNLAEAGARTGYEAEANEALKYLLENRMAEGYVWEGDFAGAELMEKIILERRKELAFRDIRWMDLKRYNLYSELAITLNREFNESSATLLPNDSRYALEIPPLEINLNPMPQNVR